MRDAKPACPSRRRLLLSFVTSAAFPLVPACAPAPDRDHLTVVPGDVGLLPDDPPVEVPLSDLPEGQRTNVRWGQVVVELRRMTSGLEALALLCTHQGCRLTWEDATAHYRCACHHGLFDAGGHPIGGAPTKPMYRVPLLVSSTTVHVGARPRG